MRPTRPLAVPAVLALALALCSGLLGAAPEKPASSELAYAFLSKAEQCFGKRDLACALENVRKALITDKGLLLAELLLGKVLLEGGNAAGAQAAAERALAHGVPLEDLADTLARAALLQGQHQQLLADTRLAPARLHGSARRAVLLARAQAQFELGQTRAALTELDLLRADDPDHLAAALAELPMRLQLGQLREAAAAVERAERLAPASADVHLARAQLLQAQGAAAPAQLAALAQALELDPRHLEARLMRAQLLLQGNRWDELRAELKPLADGHGADPRVAYLQALEAAQRGDRAAMTAALRRVTAQIDPQPQALLRFRPRLELLAGLAHVALGEADQAKPYLEAYRSSQGDSRSATLLARLYLGQHQTEAATRTLEAALAEQPGRADALGLLGAAKLSAGRPEEAVALMREALRSQESPAFYVTLGQALLRQGQLDEGRRALQAALQKDPDNADAAQALAEAALAQGEARGLQQAADVLAGQVRRQPRQPALRLQLARLQLASGQAAAVLPLLDEALRQDPDLHAARLLQAEAERRLGREDAAQARLVAMVKADQAAVDAALALAALEEARGHGAEAQGWLARAVAKARPPELRPQAALVEFHLRQRQPVEAAVAAKALLALAPEHVGALLLGARAALAQGDAAGARPLLAQAARLAGDDVAALALAGRLQLAASDLAGARATLDRALERQPDLAVLQRLRIEAALRSGDVADAQARAQRLVKQQPKAAVSHMLLGQVALARHEPAEAIQAFAQAHRLEPSTESLLRLYAAQVGQVDPARNLGLLQQWLAQRPDDALVRNALAESLVALGRLADARRHYELLLKQTDANAVRNNLADVLLRLKDPGALALAKEALRREPANPTILDTAGWAHVQAGQAEQALPLLRDALARDPAAAGTRYHLAQALATLGRRDEALQALRTALADNQAAFDRPAALTLLRSLETGH